MQKQIWEYLKGMRTGKAAHRIEREALSDPFLFEALEGIEGIKADHELVMAALEKQIRSKALKKRGYAIPLRILVAACLLIGGIACWLLYLPQETVTMTKVMRPADTIGTGNFSKAAIRPNGKLPAQAVPEKNEGKNDQETLENNAVVPGAGMMAATVKGPATDDKTGEGKELGKEADIQAGKTMLAATGYTLKKIEKDCREEEEKTVAGIALMSKNNTISALADDSVNPSDTVRQSMASSGKEVKGKALSDKGRGNVERKSGKQESNEGMADRYRMGVRQKKKFPGSLLSWEKGFKKYVTDSLRYPPEVVHRQVSGEVILAVRLNKQGRPSRIKVVKKLSPACDREAIRIVETYKGRWETSGRAFTVKIVFQPPSDTISR